ncbi:MAG: hypothetical protein FOGNACKC_02273 [Anaerolineae bacterium]|nr:hypothetical protein [Anaerolineae bacterium]
MYAVLFDNRKRRPLTVAARMAVLEFASAPHTRGLKPAELRFHPLDRPEVTSLDGLDVVTDPDVPRHHIRVAVNPVDELQQERERFAALVDQAVGGAA